MQKAYEEIIEFIARGITPGNVVAFRPSEATKTRARYLIGRAKNVEINEDETTELKHYLQLEHLMRLAKARAKIVVVD